jgi:hypothetical protein
VLSGSIVVAALAVAGAVAIFFELEQGFGDLVRISPEVMRRTVKALEARAEKCAVSVRIATFGR